MSSLFPLKTTHAPVKAYFAALATFHKHGHTTEGNTRSAFADLVKKCCSPYGWHLVEEYQFKGTGKQPLRADGALVDDLTLVHGLWEAKDTADDLQAEIKKKVAKGYPLTNILFQSPTRAVLYQNNRIALDTPITEPEKLLEILTLFFEHRQAHEVDWESAVTKFAEKIPDLAKGVTEILAKEYDRNATFRDNFLSFAELCRQSINPDLSDDAIRKMLVQHLLTERIFRKVFNNQEFLQRNVIAAEIEKVIRSITARHFSRDEFLKPLDRFYTAIEKAAESQTGYTEKQHFLNAVYEKFFQRFDTKQADTHGIVYTPQPIVDFMVRSVEEILQQEFGKSLSDKGVHILDPFTGTGNFITRIMQQIKRSALPQKYAEELHCNEIMLLPYYIASMNIEHAYMERVGEYKPFEGICLVDSFDMRAQSSMFAEKNTERIERQRTAPIFVVIGNPPYNAWQETENQNNRNRRYPALDARISETYARSSRATNKIALSDPYIKALRWATDKVQEDGGVVAFVTNSGFVEGIAADGLRKHLMGDFNTIYVLDLGGNVRRNPKLSGTTHNVFGIQIGVSVNILVRKPGELSARTCTLNYADCDPGWTRGQKYRYLDTARASNGIEWKVITPDDAGNWLNPESSDPKESALPMKEMFRFHSNGLKTGRDSWAYNFQASELTLNIQKTISRYGEEMKRWKKARLDEDQLSSFLVSDPKEISWTSDLKDHLLRNTLVEYSPGHIMVALYRPYTRMNVYFDQFLNQRRYQLPKISPTRTDDSENPFIGVTAPGSLKPFACLASVGIQDLHSIGDVQCFSYYFSDKGDGSTLENLSDTTLKKYRAHYGSRKITKWNIFHATYAVLHHPEYRTRYAANLKRELPRIPFPPDFHAFARRRQAPHGSPHRLRAAARVQARADRRS